jgi:transposase
MRVRLAQRLFPPMPALPLAERPVPVWEAVPRELKAGKDLSLFLLWQEYKARAPEGFQYSWCCEQYRAWAGKLELVMRQEHRAREKCFMDYAGQTVPVIDRLTGEARAAHVFVAVLGASHSHLCRGHLDRGAARLDWRPRAGLRLLWRDHRDPGPG